MCVRWDIAVVQKNWESYRPKDFIHKFVPMPFSHVKLIFARISLRSPSATREGNKKIENLSGPRIYSSIFCLYAVPAKESTMFTRFPSLCRFSFELRLKENHVVAFGDEGGKQKSTSHLIVSSMYRTSWSKSCPLFTALCRQSLIHVLNCKRIFYQKFRPAYRIKCIACRYDIGQENCFQFG